VPRQASNVDFVVAARVRQRRKLLEMSQEQVASQLGISFQQVQKYEKGVNRIAAGRLFDLARVFGIPVQALFPDFSEFSEEDADRREDTRQLSEFALCGEGWQLCCAFAKISNAEKRKAVIELIEGLSGDDVPGDSPKLQ